MQSQEMCHTIAADTTLENSEESFATILISLAREQTTPAKKIASISNLLNPYCDSNQNIPALSTVMSHISPVTNVPSLDVFDRYGNLDSKSNDFRSIKQMAETSHIFSNRSYIQSKKINDLYPLNTQSISVYSDSTLANLSPPPSLQRESSTDTIKLDSKKRLASKNSSRSKKAKRTVEKSAQDEEMCLEDAIPRLQQLKEANDQYSPKWVRYHGVRKEGMCDLCTPNKWLQLKDSAFWYHKQFFHGISSVTGSPFASPLEYRTIWLGSVNPNAGVAITLNTEGKCSCCSEWIPLFKNKKRFSHYFASTVLAKRYLLQHDDLQKEHPILLCESPLQILAGRLENRSIFVPPGIMVCKSILNDTKTHESGMMSSVWYKHAQKCHKNSQ